MYAFCAVAPYVKVFLHIILKFPIFTVKISSYGYFFKIKILLKLSYLYYNKRHAGRQSKQGRPEEGSTSRASRRTEKRGKGKCSLEAGQ